MRAQSGAAWLYHAPLPATQRFAHKLRSARCVKIFMSHTPDISRAAGEAPMAVRARAQHCTAIRQATKQTPSTKLQCWPQLAALLIMIHVIDLLSHTQ